MSGIAQITRIERDRRLALAAEGRKWCPGCSTAKPFDEFWGNKRRVDGRQPHCTACMKERAQAHNAKPETKHRRRVERYGISPEQFDEMMRRQAGGCAACGYELQGGRMTHIDHCHASGAVRGLLCLPCNLALGYLKDDPERIQGLLAYLSSNGH